MKQRDGESPPVLVFCVAFVLCAAFSREASATSWPPLPPGSSIFTEATHIFEGIVDSVEYSTHLTSHGREIPSTSVSLRVISVLKGDDIQLSRTVTVRHIGGRIQGTNKRMAVAGQASLRVGDHVILFCNQDKFPLLATVRGGQGVLRVVRDGEVTFLVDDAGHPLVGWRDDFWVVEPTLRCRRLGDSPESCVWFDDDGEPIYEPVSAAEFSLRPEELTLKANSIQVLTEGGVTDAASPLQTEDQFNDALRRHVGF